ncbi:MAG: hypothetical protein KDK11_11840 [Maritimibacter sp.]|nr:hypothetical protein [Maritimibacter sp.]
MTKERACANTRTISEQPTETSVHLRESYVAFVNARNEFNNLRNTHPEILTSKEAHAAIADPIWERVSMLEDEIREAPCLSGEILALKVLVALSDVEALSDAFLERLKADAKALVALG